MSATDRGHVAEASPTVTIIWKSGFSGLQHGATTPSSPITKTLNSLIIVISTLFTNLSVNLLCFAMIDSTCCIQTQIADDIILAIQSIVSRGE